VNNDFILTATGVVLLISRFVMRTFLPPYFPFLPVLCPLTSGEFGQMTNEVKMRQGSHTGKINWYRIWSWEWVGLTKCTLVAEWLICLLVGWIYSHTNVSNEEASHPPTPATPKNPNITCVCVSSHPSIA